MQGWSFFLEGGAVPLRQRGSGVISALREFQDHIVWRLPPASILIRQNEFAQLRMKRRGGWLNFCIRESTGLHLPQKCERNSLKTRSACKSTRQNRLAYSGS